MWFEGSDRGAMIVFGSGVTHIFCITYCPERCWGTLLSAGSGAGPPSYLFFNFSASQFEVEGDLSGMSTAGADNRCRGHIDRPLRSVRPFADFLLSGVERVG